MRLSHPLHLLQLACLLTCALPTATAQQRKVLPAGMDYVEGPLVYTYPFGRQTAGMQLLYDASEVTTQQGLLLGMRFRQSQVTASQLYPSYTKDYTVTAYTVSTPAAAMVADLATNVGNATGTVVFSGSVTLPAVQLINTYPAPFDIHIPFTTPYLFNGSQGNLLLLIETADTTTVPAGSYRIDAVNFRSNLVTGLVANLDDFGCTAQGLGLTLATDATQAIVGGSITQTLTSPAIGAFPAAMATLSFTTNPIDLAGFGMPGCTSWLGPLVSRFVFENPSGGYPPVVWTLPNSLWLEGVALAGQALGLGSSGLLSDSVTSNAQATRIGPAGLPVVRMDMAFRLTGNWSKGSAGTFIAVVEFEGVFP